MQKLKLVSSVALSAILFSGCFNGSPIPSKKGQKPTVYIESHTLEKFKDLSVENADARGVSQFFVEDKRYLRCDILPEAVASFAREGFEIVHDKQKADYSVELTLLSCGQGTEYFDYRDATPPKDASFYKNNLKHSAEYMKKTEGVVLPNKYYNMPQKDKDVLSAYFNTFAKENDTHVETNEHINGINLIGHSAGFLSSTGGSNSTANAFGAAGMAMGLISVFTSVRNPDIHNEFKITKNSSGKSFSRDVYIFPFTSQEWKINMKSFENMVMSNIPYKELE